MDRIAAALIAIALVTQPARAQTETGESQSVRSRLLVLNNGRVVTGRISPRAGGYDVRKSSGQLFISSDTVRFEASDLDDAYRKLRATFTELTPKVHLEIAQWCIANNQIRAARQELLDALHLEPSNQTARTMLKRLEVLAAPKPATEKPKTLKQRRMDQFLRTEYESLGGLTEKQAATFTARIQPILERNCGNSSCHGSRATNDFVLKRSRGRTSRLVSERNLAVVLQQILFENPESSPLLKAIDEPHSRSGRPILTGPAGRVQRDIIVAWVKSVTAKDAEPATAAIPPSVFPSSRSPRRDRSVVTAGASKTTAPTAIRPTGVTRKLTESEHELLRQVRAGNQEDPFDPGVFNRRYHGTQGNKNNPGR